MGPAYVVVDPVPYVAVDGAVVPVVAGAPPSGTGLVYVDGGANTTEAVTIGSGLSLSGSYGSRTLSASGGGGNLIGAYADRPAAGTAGRVYVTTDGGVAYMDDGSEWRPMLAGKLGKEPSTVASWTALNQGGATISDGVGGGGPFVYAPKQASGEWHRMIYRASGINSSTRCVITACFRIHFAPYVSGAYPSAGVFAMNSSDGKFVCCGTAQSGSTGFGYAHLDRYSWNGSSVSYVSSVSVQADFAGLNSTVALISSYHWVRLDIDPASTRKYYRSADGANWVLVASTAYNDHITAWDRVGFYANPQTAGIAASLVSWQVGTSP